MLLLRLRLRLNHLCCYSVVAVVVSCVLMLCLFCCGLGCYCCFDVVVVVVFALLFLFLLNYFCRFLLI